MLHLSKGQTLHRISIESKAVDSIIKNSKKGLNYGFKKAITGLVGSVLCILNGFEIGVSKLGVSRLLGLVSVFVYRSKQRDKEWNEKKENHRISIHHYIISICFLESGQKNIPSKDSIYSQFNRHIR